MSKRLVSVGVMLALMLIAVAPSLAQGDLSGELEIFSWWAGDEGPALEALIAKYNELYPNVEVINATVTGGSGVNARAVLKTRMLGGDPPDSFQVHAGQELIGTYVVADAMEDLTFLFEEEGWMDTFPAGLIDLLSTDEGIWSVPVNIHRSNVMWYVPANLEEWGVEVPADWDAFLAICPTLQEAGVTPLVVGENWTVVHLWENVALAQLGAEGYRQLWAGEKAWTDEDAVAVWSKFSEILDCTNIDEDAASLPWQQATDKVVNGEAAFNIMGDWAAGYMSTTLGLVPGEGFWLGAGAGHRGRLQHAVRLVRLAGRRAAPRQRDRVAAPARLGRGAGHLQPAQGVDCRPHRQRPDAVQRLSQVGGGRLAVERDRRQPGARRGGARDLQQRVPDGDGTVPGLAER